MKKREHSGELMLNKALVVFTILFIIIKIVASPIIIRNVYERKLESLWFISYFFSFLLVILITICIIQIKKYTSKKTSLQDKDEITKKNIYNHIILPLFLILLAVYLSYVLRILIGFPYHGKSVLSRPIYLSFLPFFLSTLIIGIIFGKKGWLLGFFASCVRINLFFLQSYILYSSWHRMTTFEFIGFVTRSYQYHSLTIIENLVFGTLGGLLGGLMRYQLDLMKLSKAMLLQTRKRIRILSLAILIIIVLCLVSGSVIFSQFAISKMREIPFNKWMKTFKGRCMSFQPTKDGGFIFVGKVDQPKMKYSYLMKIDSHGDTVWNKKYDGALLRMVQETSDRNYIITGSKKINGNKNDVLLIKADRKGDIIWEKTYGGEQSDWGVSVIETWDGNFVIAGISDSNCAILMKTDEEGDVIWQRGYWSDSSLENFTYFGYSILETTDNGYIVSASTGGRIQIIKVNNNGEHEWISDFLCESYNDHASSVVHTFDDCYVTTGYLFSKNMTDDICLVKVDNNGEKIWTRIYERKGFDFGYDVKQTPDSGYVIIGTTTHIRSYPKYIPQFIRELRVKYSLVEDIFYHMKTGIRTQICILKMDGEGNELWKQEFFGTGSMDPDEDCLHENHSYFFIQITMDGGYIVAGKSSLHGFRDIDFYIHKLK